VFSSSSYLLLKDEEERLMPRKLSARRLEMKTRTKLGEDTGQVSKVRKSAYYDRIRKELFSGHSRKMTIARLTCTCH
jgi:hypothetical protein